MLVFTTSGPKYLPPVKIIGSPFLNVIIFLNLKHWYCNNSFYILMLLLVSIKAFGTLLGFSESRSTNSIFRSYGKSSFQLGHINNSISLNNNYFIFLIYCHYTGDGRACHNRKRIINFLAINCEKAFLPKYTPKMREIFKKRQNILEI